jgi:hypothetical protein
MRFAKLIRDAVRATLGRAILMSIAAALVYSSELSALESDCDLGEKVRAVREAIADPSTDNALSTVTELGQDSRYYVMVRGWLSMQLEGDMSIVRAQGGSLTPQLATRIDFVRTAIRAIDLE